MLIKQLFTLIDLHCLILCRYSRYPNIDELRKHLNILIGCFNYFQKHSDMGGEVDLLGVIFAAIWFALNSNVVATAEGIVGVFGDELLWERVNFNDVAIFVVAL